MRIDAHHHFWHPARGDYGWMDPGNPILARDYGPADLAPALSAAGIDRTVLVQAAPTLAETDHLLSIAADCAFVGAVVGWIDFEDPGQITALTRLAAQPLLRGLRPMIQDIADVDWMLRPDLSWAYEAMIAHDLRFDALGHPRHLANFARLADRYPALQIIVDHGMKPQIAEQEFAVWAAGLRNLAQRPNVACKLSGLVTEAAPGWSHHDLKPYSDHILSCFGPARIMWGSDWPVCRLQAEYGDWLSAAQALCAHLGQRDQDLIFGGTAARLYGIAG